MFAIVQFKNSKLVEVVPFSWIFGLTVDDVSYTKSYQIFWTTVKPVIIDWKSPIKTPTSMPLSNDVTYKGYIKSIHSKC